MTPVQGHAELTFGVPCACERASANPPAGVAELVDYLGNAAALGGLLARVGLPEGPALLQSVGAFVAASPSLVAGELETGGAWDSFVRGASKGAAKALEAVEGAAGRVYRAAAKQPGILLGAGTLGVAALLGSQWLTTDERQRLATVEGNRALAVEVASRLSPEEAAKLARDLAGQTAGGGGLSSWLPWVGLAIAALVVWRIVGPAPRGSG